MPAEQQRRRRAVFDAEGAGAGRGTTYIAEQSNSPVRPSAVGAREPRQQLEVHLLREPAERAVAHLVAHLVPHARLQVMRGQPEDLRRDVG